MATSNQPLAEKLQIKPGDTIAPIGAPANYKAMLGELPDGATVVVRAPNNGAALVHLFVGTMAELETQLPRALQAMAKSGAVWVSWQKRKAGRKSGISRDAIRTFAAELGLQSVRAVSLDDAWSALKLAR
jgi:hypothetical protein